MAFHDLALWLVQEILRANNTATEDRQLVIALALVSEIYNLRG